VGKKQVSPIGVVIALIVSLAVLAGMWWKFLGPGSAPKWEGPIPQPPGGPSLGTDTATTKKPSRKDQKKEPPKERSERQGLDRHWVVSRAAPVS
jgi:hypothetical protein